MSPGIVGGTLACSECMTTRKEARPLFAGPVIRYSGKGPVRTFRDRASRLHFHPRGRFEQNLRCEMGHSKRMSWRQICWCGWKRGAP